MNSLNMAESDSVLKCSMFFLSSLVKYLFIDMHKQESLSTSCIAMCQSL